VKLEEKPYVISILLLNIINTHLLTNLIYYNYTLVCLGNIIDKSDVNQFAKLLNENETNSTNVICLFESYLKEVNQNEDQLQVEEIIIIIEGNVLLFNLC